DMQAHTYLAALRTHWHDLTHRVVTPFPTRRSSDLEDSTMTAVATSPKMKWLSRSLKFRWAEQISGLIIRTAPTEPEAIKSAAVRSEEHTSELQSREKLVCRLLLEKKRATN